MKCSALGNPPHLGHGAGIRPEAAAGARAGTGDEVRAEASVERGGGAGVRDPGLRCPRGWAREGQDGQQERDAELHRVLVAGAAAFHPEPRDFL